MLGISVLWEGDLRPGISVLWKGGWEGRGRSLVVLVQK